MRGAAPSRRVLSFWAVALFVVWSNSFIAIGYLLGGEQETARFDWIGLTVARFVPAALVCLLYCLLFRRRETLRLVRARWRRLLVCGGLAVPAYNFSLYYGQQHGVAAPIASLTTTLAPLFLMVMGACFLGERLTKRRILGFVLALTGVVLISRAKASGDGSSYSGLILITALAPLSWSIFSVLSKPVSRDCSPVLWTYLSIIVGTIPLLAVLPFAGGPQLLRLDGAGWFSILFLSLVCTVLGFSIWVVLLKHLPASTVGLTVFLNPPLTTVSKAVWALALPSVFSFRIVGLEWAGGAVVLVGLCLALINWRSSSN